MDEKEREEFLELLLARYGKPSSLLKKAALMRKKYAWLAMVAFAKSIKRLIDLVVSFFALILFLPLMALICCAIYFLEGRPIFYTSYRIGQHGKPFLFTKFRTMQPGAEELQEELLDKAGSHSHKRFKIRADPRITKLGKFLRKSSLDELPQLFSVLKGEMSLVGPRPPLPKEVLHFSIRERQKLSIKPGLTCFWQISGRSDIPFPKQIELDLAYIQSRSLKTDLWILLKTIPVILLGRGAY